MIESLNITGTVNLELYNKGGVKINSMNVSNLVTTLGKNFIVRKIINDAEDVSTIAIGTGTTAANVNDTDLDTSLASATILFSSVDSVDTNIVSFTTTFEEGEGTGSITEVGLFSDNSALLCRTVLTTPFEKSPTDYLTVTWKIKIG